MKLYTYIYPRKDPRERNAFVLFFCQYEECDFKRGPDRC